MHLLERSSHDPGSIRAMENGIEKIWCSAQKKYKDDMIVDKSLHGRGAIGSEG